MKHIEILDCTLRDGGYVNNWNFGIEPSQEIVNAVCSAGADYAELGFIRLGEYEHGKMQFTDMSQVAGLFRPSTHKLAIMVELGYGYPAEAFPVRSDDTADLIRVTIWKRMMSQGVDYCMQLRNKGYEVGVQATRTDQYSPDEFAEFVRLYNQVEPKAFYIVDTFGLMDKNMLLSYAKIADDNLTSEARIGYHAHNNMQQAVCNAVAFAEHNWNHDLIIDTSVMGIGRGAGNLPEEVFFKYLNEKQNGAYYITPLYDVAERHLQPIYERTPWGYSVPYLLSAANGCNPTYVDLFKLRGLTYIQMLEVFKEMRRQGLGIRYDEQAAADIIASVIGTTS
ncbi:MAG: hypothetical protein J6D01_01670 [Muribaculaceae bacterium]|nr:hypothetical protein [Muribaculaceae bacterium]